MKLSIIIPACNELFLQKTLNSLIESITDDTDIIVYLDGYWPNPPLQEHPKVTIVHSDRVGMRSAINGAASIARGKYIMKCDAHCLFDKGFDTVLLSECADDWVVVPRRYSLDAENWKILDTGKAAVDYHYLAYPYKDRYEIGMHGEVWKQRQSERIDILVDDEMSSQGSCWFTTKEHFNRIGGLENEGYGSFTQEFQEIGNKTWLGGGQVKVNKKTWYAHLHKGKTYGRMYSLSKDEMIKGNLYCVDYWLNNRYPKQIHKFEWLIDKFWPVPTWPSKNPEDWKL